MICKNQKNETHIMLNNASYQLALFFISVIFLVLPACSHIPLHEHHDSSLAVHQISSIDPSFTLSPHPDGARIALADDGLFVHSPGSEARTVFDTSSPSALAWSPDGNYLAAAFENSGNSVIKVYSHRGKKVSEKTVPGNMPVIFWTSDDEILALSAILLEHRFGTSLQQMLHKLTLKGEPVTTVLHNSTIVPLTLKLYDSRQLINQIKPQLSSLRDELLYVRLFNPPVSPPYFKLYVRNLASGAEQELTKLGINAGSALITYDGEEAIWSDGTGDFWRQTIWGQNEPRKMSFSGSRLLLSKNSTTMIRDGKIYNGNVKLGEFQPNCNLLFMEDGRLLIGWENRLFIMEGLPRPPATKTLTKSQIEKLIAVRAWRSSGSITATEYDNSVKRILE